MKRKELSWMLLPCLLILGLGWYFTRSREAASKLRVRIDEIKLVPATPRDVARGYDSVVLIEATMRAPSGVELGYFIHNGQQSSMNYQLQIVNSTGRFVQSVNNPGQLTRDEQAHLWKEQITYPFKLSQIPASRDALFVRVQAHGEVYSLSKDKYLHRAHSDWHKLQVRAPNQQIKTPVVTKARPFKLIGIESKASANPGINYHLTFYVELFEPLQLVPGRGRVSLDKSQVFIDGKPIADDNGTAYSPGRNPMDTQKHFALPPKCRNAKFKGELSINECWPLPVEVELRKNGKDIQRPMPKLPTDLPPL
ncbi:MAG TPA: hypothetical protein VGB77_19070 [Abditibacteriaceae bacterium]|jgi:hypothetical protein